MSSETYVKAAVQNVEETLAKSEKRFSGRCVAPLRSGYRPETNDSAQLKSDGLQYYQEVIGVIRWIFELGGALMSAHIALPRIGHLYQVIHMFGYLKLHSKRRISFDAVHTSIDEHRLKSTIGTTFIAAQKE